MDDQKGVGVVEKVRGLVLLDAGILLAIATGFLYTISLANLNGVNVEVGMVRDYFDYGPQKVLYNAFFIALMMSVSATIVIFFFGAIFGWVLETRFSANAIISLSSTGGGPENDSCDPKEITLAKRRVKAILVVSFTWIFGCFALIVCLLLSEKIGRDIGVGIKNEAKSEDFSLMNFVKLGKDQVYVVSCDASKCAGLRHKDMEVMYFKKVDIFNFSTSSKK